MIRIRFDIDQKSPFLGLLKGTLYVEEIPEIASIPELLFKCKFSKDNYSLGYSSFEEDEGIPSDLFKSMKFLIDQTIRSYWKGMMLENSDYLWIPTCGPESVLRINNLRKALKEYQQKQNE